MSVTSEFARVKGIFDPEDSYDVTYFYDVIARRLVGSGSMAFSKLLGGDAPLLQSLHQLALGCKDIGVDGVVG